MTTGTMIGTTIGTAMQLAMVAAVPLAIGAFLVAARDEWTKQTASWGLKVPDLFSGQGALAPNAGGQRKMSENFLVLWNKALHQL